MVAVVLSPGLASAGDLAFKSPREALRQGVSAFHGGYYEIALPALQYASDRKELLGSYYLARLYADNSGTYTNHAKAYELFEKIADENMDADPDNDPRARYVGRALTALASYVRNGLPEAGVKPDQERAIFYLKNASTTFNDEDAQFELAKLQLKGDGVQVNVALGRYWLSVLSQNGHAGAQAFFADILWRGKHGPADPARALALISIAVENAPQQDRMWIEDIHQNIFCGAGEGIRKQATGLVAQWGETYGRKSIDKHESKGDLTQLTVGPSRACANGEAVGLLHQLGDGAVDVPVSKDVVAEPAPTALPRIETHGFVYGSASGPSDGLREIGAKSSLAPQ